MYLFVLCFTCVGASYSCCCGCTWLEPCCFGCASPAKDEAASWVLWDCRVEGQGNEWKQRVLATGLYKAPMPCLLLCDCLSNISNSCSFTHMYCYIHKCRARCALCLFTYILPQDDNRAIPFPPLWSPPEFLYHSLVCSSGCFERLNLNHSLSLQTLDDAAGIGKVCHLVAQSLALGSY